MSIPHQPPGRGSVPGQRPARREPIAMKDLIRFLIGWLVRKAHSRGFGSVTIQVQHGAIEIVQVQDSYSSTTLPVPEQLPPDTLRQAGVGGPV